MMSGAPWANVVVVMPRTFDLDALMVSMYPQIKPLVTSVRSKCRQLSNKEFIQNTSPLLVQEAREAAMAEGLKAINIQDHYLKLAHLKIKEIDR